MESRPMLFPNQENAEESLKEGMDLLNRDVANEEAAVKKFLKKSVNYGNLLNIIKTSIDSKMKGGGIFGGNSIYQKNLYQISPKDEEMINGLRDAKTFHELLSKIPPIKSEITNTLYGEPLLNATSHVNQEANSTRYMLHLIREIKEFADKNFYSIDPPESECVHRFTK